MATNNLNMVVRSMSTASAKMIRPPIQLFGIEGRYANALYSAASKQKNLDKVEQELVKFQGTVKSDKKLFEFVQDPTIKRALKVQAFKQVSSKLSHTPQTTNFLQLIADNGRLKRLNHIINAFKTLMAAHRGEVTCEVITAKELDAAQKQKLEKVLKSFVKSNENIQLTSKVDPTILGGMIVSIGDRYVDMSVANKIKKYTTIISATI